MHSFWERIKRSKWQQKEINQISFCISAINIYDNSLVPIKELNSNIVNSWLHTVTGPYKSVLTGVDMDSRTSGHWSSLDEMTS